MNRKQLLKFLKDAGYTGELTAAAIIKWLGENAEDVELTNAKTKKSVTADDVTEILAKKVTLTYDSEDVDVRKNAAMEEEETEEEVEEEAKAFPPDDEEDEEESEKSIGSGEGEEDEEELAKPRRKRVEARSKSHRITAGGLAGSGRTPESYVLAAERKSYNRKAARGETVFNDAEEAEVFGAFMRQWIYKNSYGNLKPSDYGQMKRDKEIIRKAGSTVSATGGSAYIPEEFSSQLIELREQYGVLPGLLGTEPMSSGMLPIPRNTADATVTWTGENVTATASDDTSDQIQLIANKLLGISVQPFERMNDSAIRVGDIIGRGFAREAARKIDEAGFNGDGTSTYGGFTGFRAAISNLNATAANIAGLVVSAGSTFETLTQTDFDSVLARIPAYADTPQCCWVMHRTAFFAAYNRLAKVAGGTMYMEMLKGKPVYFINGYPVKFAQVMPKVPVTTAKKIMALFGDFGQAAKYGEVRNSMALASTDQLYFDKDQIAIRFRQRVAINVHDVGNAHATSTSREPGPVVALALT